VTKHDWVQCVYALFSALGRVDQVELVKISKELPQTISIDTIARISESLVDAQILVWRADHTIVEFRAPRFKAAFAHQLDSTFIKTMLKNLKVNTSASAPSK
jgi:hypothetical protein